MIILLQELQQNLLTMLLQCNNENWKCTVYFINAKSVDMMTWYDRYNDWYDRYDNMIDMMI